MPKFPPVYTLSHKRQIVRTDDGRPLEAPRDRLSAAIEAVLSERVDRPGMATDLVCRDAIAELAEAFNAWKEQL